MREKGRSGRARQPFPWGARLALLTSGRGQRRGRAQLCRPPEVIPPLTDGGGGGEAVGERAAALVLASSVRERAGRYG